MYKKLLFLCFLMTAINAQESDRFSGYLPNKYRQETYDMIMRWQNENPKENPRNGVIKKIKQRDLTGQEVYWTLSALDIRGWTLVNEVYLGDRSQQPQLYALLDRLAVQYDVPEPTIFIPDLPLVNMMACSYDRNLHVLIIPFGVFANMVWDTAAFEGALAHEFGHIKHCDSVTLERVAVSMRMFKIFGPLLAVAGTWAWYKKRYNQEKWSNAAAAGLLAIMGTWLVDVLASVFVSRHIEKRADRLAAEMGYGHGFARGIKKMSKEKKQSPLVRGANLFLQRFIHLTHAFFPRSEESVRTALIDGYGHPSDTQRAARIKELAEEHDLITAAD